MHEWIDNAAMRLFAVSVYSKSPICGKMDSGDTLQVINDGKTTHVLLLRGQVWKDLYSWNAIWDRLLICPSVDDFGLSTPFFLSTSI